MKKIMNEAIDDWKKDIFDVDDARYGIYLSHKSVELSATRPCCTSFLHTPEVEF